MQWAPLAAAFGLGAIIGSFLNVVIHRYPRDESIVFPPSHCPHCDRAIRPWDNIPILSYLLLLGRCRDCRQPISPRYPLVELANGLFYAAILQRTGITAAFPLIAAIVSMTIALIYIDLEIQILPDVIDLPGIILGVAIGALHLGQEMPMVLATSLTDSLLGAALGAGILLFIAFAYRLIRNAEGMGYGDVKMLAMIGAVVGWSPLLPVLFGASVAGAVTGIGMAIARRANLRFALPFGVFLGLSFLVVLFFGRTLFVWYLKLLLR
ncbi:MAG TPA: prepilin peptidase [Thermoanaerobaculia bacterium]|nr:prepilin peptidase [Thermoanaerobaculia bacterium]